MDNKYQDLHVYNLKDIPIVIRMLEIKQIKFTENEILIDYINGATPMTLILPKRNIAILID